MRNRFLASLGVLAVVITVVSLAPVPVAGQAPTATAKAAVSAKTKPPAPAKTWTPPRTPYGQPDVQGVWNFTSVTPLERPKELTGKEFLTAEEAAAFRKRASERVEAVDNEGSVGGSSPRTDALSPGYNAYWRDHEPKSVNLRTSLIVDPRDGRIPPRTLEAEKRAAARVERISGSPAGPEDRPVYERCILGYNSGPPIFPGGYNNNVQISQIPGYVVILNEMIHNARIVPLGGRPHLSPNIRQWVGDSRGHWEGNTLVVDSTNFTDKGTGTLSIRSVTTDENLHLVERFTRTDADTLLYEFTVDDPTTWTRPWTAAIPMTKTQDRMYEFACHEGNYFLGNTLSGARAKEKNGLLDTSCYSYAYDCQEAEKNRSKK